MCWRTPSRHEKRRWQHYSLPTEVAELEEEEREVKEKEAVATGEI